MKKLILIATMAALTSPAFAKKENSDRDTHQEQYAQVIKSSAQSDAEAPQTWAERLQNIQERHNK